jgi:hypothetical protein
VNMTDQSIDSNLSLGLSVATRPLKAKQQKLLSDILCKDLADKRVILRPARAAVEGSVYEGYYSR